MPHLPLDDGVFHTPPPQNLQINQNQYSNIALLSPIIPNSSYIPYPGCVFEHILNASLLTCNEKLFYLLADSLSLINGKNVTRQRSVALSSIQWAEKLGCSKTEIFSLQKSLAEKNYFVVIRDKNKYGKNKRNIIIPTLPDKVFEELYNTTDRFDLNPKHKNHIPSATYFSTLTSLSPNSVDNPYIQTKKRTYLDTTKLFIKINYQILSSITTSEQLSPFDKIVLLDSYSKCYKNYIKSKQGNDYFAFTTSYQELESQFACSRYTLSKTLKKLQNLNFIIKNRFFVKNNNENDNLHDRSLWNITVSLPQEYLPEIQNIKHKSTKRIEGNVAKSDPYCAKSDHLLIKDFKLKNNTKNLDSTDANSIFFENSKFLSELSVSYKDFRKNEILTSSTKQRIDQIEAKKEILATDVKVATADSNENTNDNIEIKTTKITKFSPNAILKDWYPLLQEDAGKLNLKSGREFSNNFINELLLKLNDKYPGRKFATKNHVISYMTSALRRELHQSPMVNHETFRFVRNDEEFIASTQRETYLRKVEYSTDTDYESQLRRKIAAEFESKLAYQLLTTVSFTTTVQERRFGNNEFDDEFGDRYLNAEPKTVIQEEDNLSDDTINNQQTDIIENNQNHSFTVQLNEETLLSDLQRQILEDSIISVYGHVDIKYQQSQYNYRKSNKSQQGEIDLEELDPNSVWYKVRGQLKKQFGEFIDKAWFSKLIAEETLQTETLTLFAPSNFMRDWIKNQYGYVIKQFAQELGYQLVELVTKEQLLSYTG